MIQIERGRREQLAAEKARVNGLNLINQERERSRLEAEAAAKVANELSLDDKNIQFLKGLGFPEYFQEIIEEEHLQGAHILWSISRAKGYTPKAIVSLVLGIEYEPPYDVIRTGTVDGMPFEQRDVRSSGYNIRQLQVRGSSTEQEVSIVTKPKVAIAQSASTPSAFTQIFLPRRNLYDLTTIREFVASSYVDLTVGGSAPNEFYSSWPFNEWVPEAEAVRDRIALESMSPVE